MLQQHEKDLEGLVLQLDADALLSQFCFLNVHFEDSEADDSQFFVGYGHNTTSDRTSKADYNWKF
jgi:hypothetical protein